MAATGQGTAGQAAGGDAAAQQGQQQGGGEAGQQQGPDLGALADQLGQLTQGQEQMREFLQSAPWQQQGDPGQQADPAQQQQTPAADVDLSFLDDPTIEPQQMAERFTGLVNNLVRQGVQQGLQQHVQPLADNVAEQRREGEMYRLVDEFPEMGDRETANKVVAMSKQYAEMLGVPELGKEPAFWRVMYAAGRAFDAAAQEQQGSGDPGAATLEGGGGATPGGGQQGDRFDAALAVKQGAGALPWR